jgi:hypothetical protein
VGGGGGARRWRMGGVGGWLLIRVLFCEGVAPV